jgi:dTDP-glucose 4,6-dehydratase
MIDLQKEFGGRTVFVTGGDGFIGSHLVDELVALGSDVRVLVESTAHNPLINIGHQKDKIKILRGNLTDKHSLDLAVKSLEDSHDKPIVFHLAAQAHVGESWVRPVETLMTNTLGTFNLLQAIVDSGIEIYKLNYAGTAEEYGHNPEIQSQDGVHLHERSPVNPTSIYATSKLAGDFLTLNFFHAYDMPNVVVRMFNNFGPRQSPRYVTGVIITQALLRDKILLGNLTPRRDFTYVEDGVIAHMHIAAKGKTGETYCYGYGKDVSIKEWAELIVKVGKEMGMWGEKEILSDPKRFEPGTSGFRPGHSDVMKLIVGYQKLHELTGWDPKTTWEEGLAKTIKWYAENKEKWMGIKDW